MSGAPSESKRGGRGSRGDDVSARGGGACGAGWSCGRSAAMLGVRGGLAAALWLRRARAPLGATRCLHSAGARRAAGESETAAPVGLDPVLLDFLVCPLSKKPLRYEASTNELINEELGIAYPIIDGIPNMIPQTARMLKQDKKQEQREEH
ncbi:protein preY, mitochondrial [Erinaceus europaeus]|uniref:Protein preY, mitochondrial n=1 Tax=Erinaceus europaeus TaxID=9365 RepID=A0A1S3A736_ERIEU|nr:protein preY, mitochondrial [Erinaceus europaeus]